MDVSGTVGGTESVRVFVERRLLLADLTTVGEIGFATVGVCEGVFLRVGVCEGVFLRVGVCDGVFLRVGGTDASTKLDPRDAVSVLDPDRVFDVRPLLLRWVAGLLLGEG